MAPERAMSREARLTLASGKDAFLELPADVGEPEVAPLERISKPQVIDAEKVQQRGMEVIHADGVLDNVDAEIASLSIRRARTDATSGHPNGEGIAVMLATIVVGHSISQITGDDAALRVTGATKFRAKYDQGIFEHVAVAQILKETRSGCIHLASALSHLFRQRPMAIPTGMVELNETDALFSKTACNETVPRKAAGCLYIWAVKSADGRWLGIDGCGLWHTGLHAEGELELSDAGGELGLVPMLILRLMHPAECGSGGGIQTGGHAGRAAEK